MPWFRRRSTLPPETPEFEAAIRLYEDARRSFGTVLRESERMNQFANDHAKAHFELTQNLGRVAFTEEQPQVSAFIEAEKVILERVDALQQQFQRLFIAPLAILLESEFSECESAKQHYEDTRNRFATYQNKLQRARNGDADKLISAENAFYIAEQQYLHAKREFLLRLQSVEQRKRQIFEDNMRTYIDMEAEMLESNIALLQSVAGGQFDGAPLLSFQRPDFQQPSGLPALPPAIKPPSSGSSVLARAQEQVEQQERLTAAPPSTVQSGTFPTTVHVQQGVIPVSQMPRSAFEDSRASRPITVTSAKLECLGEQGTAHGVSNYYANTAASQPSVQYMSGGPAQMSSGGSIVTVPGGMISSSTGSPMMIRNSTSPLQQQQQLQANSSLPSWATYPVAAPA